LAHPQQHQPRRLRGLLLLPHRADKAETFARQSLDHSLRFSVVADRRTDRIDAGRERRFRYDASTPDGGDELVFADDTFAIPQEVIEQIEYLRRQGHEVRDATELAPLGIKHTILEKIAQAVSLVATTEATLHFGMAASPRAKVPVRKM